MTMIVDKKHAAQALFKSVDNDGTEWLFVALANDDWAITRNGQEIAVGSVMPVSLSAGIDKFLSLTRSTVRSAPARDLAISAHLDRIERGKPARMKSGRPQRIPATRSGMVASMDRVPNSTIGV